MQEMTSLRRESSKLLISAAFFFIFFSLFLFLGESRMGCVSPSSSLNPLCLFLRIVGHLNLDLILNNTVLCQNDIHSRRRKEEKIRRRNNKKSVTEIN